MKLLRTKWRSMRAASRALLILAREETSFQVQLISGLVAVALSYLLRISYTDWLFVIMVIGMVFATEAINTAIEELCDHVTPEEHPNIGKIKDLGASASALAGLTAVIVGCLIFVPRLLMML